MAIVWSMHKLHAYLHGSAVTVETDHQLLAALLRKQHAPGRLMRWILALQDYEFQIRYCPGKENVVADSLSRSHEQLQLSQDVPLQLDNERMASLQQADSVVAQLILHIRTGQQQMRRYIIKDNVLYFVREQNIHFPYVPGAIQEDLVRHFHYHPLYGHLGFHKCLSFLCNSFFWL